MENHKLIRKSPNNLNFKFNSWCKRQPKEPSVPADVMPKVKGSPPDPNMVSLFWCLRCSPGTITYADLSY